MDVLDLLLRRFAGRRRNRFGLCSDHVCPVVPGPVRCGREWISAPSPRTD